MTVGAGYQCPKHHCLVAESAECYLCLVEERDALYHVATHYKKTLNVIINEAKRVDYTDGYLLGHIEEIANDAPRAV